MSLSNYKILGINHLERSYQVICKRKISEIIGKGWVPLFYDSPMLLKFSYLVGKVMGDGHLSNRFIVTFSGQKNEVINVKDFISEMNKPFFLRYKIKKQDSIGKCYSLRIFDTGLGRVLFCLGAPKGNKTRQEFLIPIWIRNSKKHAKMFLKALLEDKLTTIKIEKKNYSVSPKLKLSKKKELLSNLRLFLEQTKEMIEIFGVKCSHISKRSSCKDNQKTKDLYFYIYRNKRNILKFKKEIGFGLHLEKQRKLDECCEILRNTLRPIINKKKIINLKKTGLSIRKIASKTKVSSSTVFRVLKS